MKDGPDFIDVFDTVEDLRVAAHLAEVFDLDDAQFCDYIEQELESGVERSAHVRLEVQRMRKLKQLEGFALGSTKVAEWLLYRAEEIEAGDLRQ